MKRIIAICLLFVTSLSAWAAPAFVKFERGVSGQGASSVDVTINGVTSGNTLIVAVGLSTAQSTTCTTSGLTWTHEINQTHAVGDALDIHSAYVASGGNITVHVTVPSPTVFRVIICEYSGIASSSRVAASSSASGASGSVNAGSVVAPANSLIFCAAKTDSDLQGWVAGSGFTIRNTPNAELEPDQKIGVEDKTVSSAGTYSGTFTIVSDAWAAGVVAYREAGTGDPFPTVSSIVVAASGTQAVVTFSESVTAGAGGSGGFALAMSNGSVSLSGATGSGATRTFNLSRTVGQGETGTASYVQPGNGFEDSAGQDVGSFSGTSIVTNNSTQPTAAAVTYSPAAGSYFTSQNIVLSSSTSPNTIRYTLDGSAPTGASAQYVSPIPVSASTTIKAFAAASLFLDSPVTTAAYELGTWVTSGTAWKNFAVSPQQTGTFTWSFRASASSAAAVAIVGMSPIASTTGTDLGPIILFDASNVILARNGGAYAAVTPFTYVPGTTYEFVLTVDVANRIYSATAAQIGGSPVTIASNYAFRSEQVAATDLDNVGMLALGAGTLTVSQMSFGGVAGTIPALTSATVGSAGTTLTLAFSVPVVYGTGGNGGWTMSATGGAVTLTPTGSPTLFTTSRTIAAGQTGTISYVQPGNGVEASTGGGDLASLSGFAFNNQATVDLSAPIPSPMTFSSPPSAPTSFSTTMTASLATDAGTPPVQYYFDEVSGNSGGTDSGWQTGRTYTDTGLSPGIQYTYRVLARDSSVSLNQTSPSAAFDVVTPIIAGGKVITPAKTNGAAIVNP